MVTSHDPHSSMKERGKKRKSGSFSNNYKYPLLLHIWHHIQKHSKNTSENTFPLVHLDWLEHRCAHTGKQTNAPRQATLSIFTGPEHRTPIIFDLTPGARGSTQILIGKGYHVLIT